MKNLSANFRNIPPKFRDIPANFRDKILFFLFLQKICRTPVFNPLWKCSSDMSPSIWGIAFFISSAKLTYLKVLEKVAKVCEEPENPWNDKKCDISNFQVFPIPDLLKVGVVKYHIFFWYFGRYKPTILGYPHGYGNPHISTNLPPSLPPTLLESKLRLCRDNRALRDDRSSRELVSLLARIGQ